MKTKLFNIAVILFITSMFTTSVQALTKQWTYDLGTDTIDTDYYIDQIAADDKGGCAVVWKEDNTNTWTNTVYVTYFDKKGQKVWEKSFLDKAAEISYCTKKTVVFAVRSSGNEFIVSIDKKGVESIAEKPDADINGSMNSETIPLGDKKGFFVERSVVGEKCSLVRYTYK